MSGINKEYISVLQSIYYRFMRLRFSYRFVCNIVFRPEISSKCPDLRDCLCQTFATDAYVTIDGLFSNGTYSFVHINNKEVKSAVKDTNDKINQVIPNFHEVRNRVFAHLVKESDGSEVRIMFERFDGLFRLIANLHEQCLNILDLRSDFNGYSDDIFNMIENEIHHFSELCFAGFSQMKIKEVHEMLDGICDRGKDS